MHITDTANCDRPASDLLVCHVTTLKSDYRSLVKILHSSWNIQHCSNCHDLESWLLSHIPLVIICESHLPDGRWTDILHILRNSAKPAKLVVSSRFADERLWAEVLNLGGYDVLATPFQAQEVLHVLTTAALMPSMEDWPSAVSSNVGQSDKPVNRQAPLKLAAGS